MRPPPISGAHRAGTAGVACLMKFKGLDVRKSAPFSLNTWHATTTGWICHKTRKTIAPSHQPYRFISVSFTRLRKRFGRKRNAQGNKPHIGSSKYKEHRHGHKRRKQWKKLQIWRHKNVFLFHSLQTMKSRWYFTCACAECPCQPGLRTNRNLSFLQHSSILRKQW